MNGTGKPSRPDTATHMAIDADFTRRDDVDPLAELERIVHGAEPPALPGSPSEGGARVLDVRNRRAADARPAM